VAVPARRGQPAVAADGTDERPGAEVAEVTDLVDLRRWPTGTRAIARREEPHPGAQLTFTDVDGHRFQVFITDQTGPDIAYLEALQRGRGRAEKLICNAKDTGLANLPSADFAINAAWLTMALVAHDLLVWAQLVCLTASTPGPSQSGSATACSTPPASSCTAVGAPACSSPADGHGRHSWPSPSAASATFRCGPDRQHGPRRPAHHPRPTTTPVMNP
jgi:hypothetical protein